MFMCFSEFSEREKEDPQVVFNTCLIPGVPGLLEMNAGGRIFD